MKVLRLGEIVCLVKESDPPFLRLFGMSSFSRSLIIYWGVSLRSPIRSPKLETPSHSFLYYGYRRIMDTQCLLEEYTRDTDMAT